jgi:hypothetical protein
MQAGRIAVTEHIPGLSAHESRTPRSRQAAGSCRPGRGVWSAARSAQGRDKGSPGRFMDGLGASRPVCPRGSGAAAPHGVLRVIDRPVHVLGAPAARAALGDNLGLLCLLLRVMQQDEGPSTSYLPLGRRRGGGTQGSRVGRPAGRPHHEASCVRMGRAYDPCPIDGTRRIRHRVTRSTEQTLLRERGAS